jgi:hypothetical protein
MFLITTKLFDIYGSLLSSYYSQEKYLAIPMLIYLLEVLVS